MLPFQPNVKITILQRRALLAWNGEEQMLFLVPDVWASSPALALEIVPLPSEPGVTAGDLATFDRGRELIANFLRRLERIKPSVSLPDAVSLLPAADLPPRRRLHLDPDADLYATRAALGVQL
jgi:hypothetical protein